MTVRRRALLVLALVAGCSSRPHVGKERDRPDAARPPAVVVVDRAAPPTPSRPGSRDVALVDEREPDDDLAHAQPLEMPKGVRGTIALTAAGARPDEDWYQWVVAGAGRQVARVELSGVPGIQLGLEALDGDGQKLTASLDGGVGEAQVIPNLSVEAGHTYYLRVRAQAAKHGGAQPPPPARPYSLLVIAADETLGEEREPNDVVAQANPLGADASGLFGRRHDEDWFQLEADAPDAGAPPGATVRLELSAVEGVAPSVRIADAAGRTIAEARGGKGDELRLRNAPLPAGPALVGLRAESGFSTEARWTLRAQVEPPLEGAEVEPNDTRATATAVVAGRPVAGFLWPGDVDVFRLHADGPSLVRAQLDVPEKVDARLALLADKDRARLLADDGGAGKGEALPTVFSPGGDLFFRVSARPRDTAFDAPYKLTLTVEPDDGATEHEPDDGAAEATPIDAGRPVRGWLAPKGDQDWYRVTAPAGAATIKATLEGAARSATVAIGEGSRVAPGVGATAAAAVVAGRTYFVLVADRAKSAPSSEPYRLTVAFE